MGHFGRNYIIPDTQPLKKKFDKVQQHQKRNRVQNAVIVNNNSNTKPELFGPSKAHMAKEKANFLVPKEI